MIHKNGRCKNTDCFVHALPPTSPWTHFQKEPDDTQTRKLNRIAVPSQAITELPNLEKVATRAGLDVIVDAEAGEAGL
ncbi:Vacuolar calcium ion transporter [Fusarium oxysporum f. sp. albedinis]|nr:Vacuolar calcium ion transporter [Fusarium oxysporum f. sp. albedinis]